MPAAVDNGAPYNLSLLTEIIAGVQGRHDKACSASSKLPAGAVTLIRGLLLLQAAQPPR